MDIEQGNGSGTDPIEMPNQGRFPALRSLAVLTLSFAALKIAVAYNSTACALKYPTAFLLACAFQLLAFSLIMSSYYVPQVRECNRRKILEEAGIGCATTSFFLSFSMLLPSCLWVMIVYWVLYVTVIVIIAYGSYQEFNTVVIIA